MCPEQYEPGERGVGWVWNEDRGGRRAGPQSIQSEFPIMTLLVQILMDHLRILMRTQGAIECTVDGSTRSIKYLRTRTQDTGVKGCFGGGQLDCGSRVGRRYNFHSISFCTE